MRSGLQRLAPCAGSTTECPFPSTPNPTCTQLTTVCTVEARFGADNGILNA